MWNTVASSKYLEEYENVEVGPVSPKRFRKLHNALCSAKSVLKTGTPVQPTFLKNRKKQQVIRREEMDKMYYENKILLKKMDEIQNRHVNKPKLYSGKRKQFNVSDNRYPITEGLMNRKYKIAEQRKVDEENKNLFKRITLARPHYETRFFIEDSQKNDRFRESISRNASRLH